MSYFPAVKSVKSLRSAIIRSLAKWRKIHKWCEDGALPVEFDFGDIYSTSCPLCTFLYDPKLRSSNCNLCPLVSCDKFSPWVGFRDSWLLGYAPIPRADPDYPAMFCYSGRIVEELERALSNLPKPKRGGK